MQTGAAIVADIGAFCKWFSSRLAISKQMSATALRPMMLNVSIFIGSSGLI